MPIPKLLVTAALTAANMALTMTRKIEGPRLDDLKFTAGDYGAPLPLVWGMRRLQCPIFWAEDLREVKQTRKTKGGKFNDYTYYGTWAVALTGHEISGVRRVWFDTHLVLDLTGAGPVSPFDFSSESSGGGKGGGSAGAGGFSLNDHIAIYLGTETQEADPRMQATVEAEHGAGSCPAYRGTSYIVFKDIPLEKIGNRIPQVAVEVVSVVTDNFPYETFDINDANLSSLWGATFSSDYSRFMWSSDTYYEIWDVAARARMIAGDLPISIQFQGPLGLYNSGSFLAVSADNRKIYQFAADGLSWSLLFDNNGTDWGGVRVIADAGGTEHWFAFSMVSLTDFIFDGTARDSAAYFGTAMPVRTAFTDSEGSVWIGAVPNGNYPTSASFYRIIPAFGATGPALVTVSGLSAVNGAEFTYTTAICSTASGSDAFIFSWRDRIYAADRLTGAVIASNTDVTLDPYNLDNQIAMCPPGASSLWIQNKEISLADLTTLRTVTLDNWTTQLANGIIYDPINHALITSPTNATKITWRYLDRIGNPGITLEDISTDISNRVGIESTDYSALDQVIEGWSVTQGPASNMLEPLFDAYDSDIRLHDFTLQGVKRAGTSGGTILTERFVREGDQARYQVKLRGSELPRAVTISFADVDADQQPNNVRSARPLDASGAVGEKALDLGTLAINADDARALADRYHRRLWNEQRELTLSLTAQQLKLEPGDCRTLDLDGASDIYRLTRITVRADDVLACEWVYDHPSIATLDSATGAGFDGRDESTVIVPLLSKGFVLDIPLLSDLDEETNPVVYLAAAPYAAGSWPGAGFYESVDGEYSDELASLPSASRATWGYATDVLDDVSSPWCWDRGNSVNVVLQVGSLTGCTEADIDTSPSLNLCILGDEILNFTTATLEGDGSYTLSGFKRGRKGTEQHTGTHVARDVFLLLAQAEAEPLALGDVSTNLSFKAITAGRTESGAFPIDLSPFTGASKKPLSPVHLKGVKDSGTGDWVLTWNRRTRIGGPWTGGSTIPLGEVSEEYEVEIMNGATVVRTTTGLTSATFTWTAAMQTSDFGSGQSAVTFRVYQVSDAVGRGFVTQATA